MYPLYVLRVYLAGISGKDVALLVYDQADDSHGKDKDDERAQSI